MDRTLARLNRNRRLAKDFEAIIATAETGVLIGNIQIVERRLARPKNNGISRNRL